MHKTHRISTTECSSVSSNSRHNRVQKRDRPSNDVSGGGEQPMSRGLDDGLASEERLEPLNQREEQIYTSKLAPFTDYLSTER